MKHNFRGTVLIPDKGFYNYTSDGRYEPVMGFSDMGDSFNEDDFED